MINRLKNALYGERETTYAAIKERVIALDEVHAAFLNLQAQLATMESTLGMVCQNPSRFNELRPVFDELLSGRLPEEAPAHVVINHESVLVADGNTILVLNNNADEIMRMVCQDAAGARNLYEHLATMYSKNISKNWRPIGELAKITGFTRHLLIKTAKSVTPLVAPAHYQVQLNGTETHFLEL